MAGDWRQNTNHDLILASPEKKSRRGTEERAGEEGSGEKEGD